MKNKLFEMVAFPIEPVVTEIPRYKYHTVRSGGKRTSDDLGLEQTKTSFNDFVHY